MASRAAALRPTIAAITTLALIGAGLPAQAQMPPPSSPAPSAPSMLFTGRLQTLHPMATCAGLASTDLAPVLGAPATLTARVDTSERPTCIVAGTIAPALHFEVRLPMIAWTQRLVQVGCGGLCGRVDFHMANSEGCHPVTDGQVVLASTDMGHAGRDMAWGANAVQRAAFAEDGVHVTALAAKSLAKAFYGREPRYSYFTGCSDGGREALIEAQRHPLDFDGIVAGAPALNFSVQNSFHHWWLAAANTAPDGHAILTAIDLKPLQAAVLAACDGIDGLVDGQIDDPRQCHFDPQVLACAGPAQPGTCLTPEQVAVVRRIYGGATDGQGHKLEPGALMPGSESGWAGVFVPIRPGMPTMATMIGGEAVNNLLFTPNPAVPLTPATFPFDAAMLDRLAPARALYDAGNPDLSAFAAHGGRLILYHGWADPQISPLSTLAYWDKVGARMTEVARNRFARLYMLPGVGHCGGGVGPSEFPALAAMMAWVETGQAPDTLVARRAPPTGFGAPGMRPGGFRPGPEGPPPGGDAMGPPPGGEGMGPPPGGDAMGPPPGAEGKGPPPGGEGMGPPPWAAAEKLAPRSRPIPAWPGVVRYKGTGSVDEAASFALTSDLAKPQPIVWLGDR